MVNVEYNPQKEGIAKKGFIFSLLTRGARSRPGGGMGRNTPGRNPSFVGRTTAIMGAANQGKKRKDIEEINMYLQQGFRPNPQDTHTNQVLNALGYNPQTALVHG